MIEFEYKRSAENEYEYRMLEENSIPVFLSFYIRTENDREYIVYDTENMVTLTELAARVPLKHMELCLIIDSLKQCRAAINEYLLTPSGLFAAPDYVYYDAYSEKLKFCFYPDRDGDEFSSYTKLTEFLLLAIDYDDEFAVKLAYEIYASVLNKDYEFEKYIKKEIYEKYLSGINTESESTTANLTVNNSGNNTGYNIDNRESITSYSDNAHTRLTGLSIVCLTLLTVIITASVILLAAGIPIMAYFAHNTGMLAAAALAVSLLAYIPIINISDIRRARARQQP